MNVHSLPSWVRDKLPYRAAFGLIYVSLLAYYLSDNPDASVFIGMFRTPKYAGESTIAYNLPSVAFMAFGLLLAMEQPSEYLVRPDSLVFIRKHRGWRQFVRYIGILLGYASAFTLPQLVVSWLVIDVADVGKMLASAVYAVLTLLMFLCTANVGYLIGYRYAGYAVVVLFEYLCAASSDVQIWLNATWFVLPTWVYINAVITALLFLVNYRLFIRAEVL